MRQVRNPQMKLGEICIEDIELDLKSRDDIPALLLGLQHLCADGHFRSRLFALLEEHILPGTDRSVGRPGMEMWRILVMGVVKQGLGCDFDRLHELVNQHMTLRQFLGHAEVWDKHRYKCQTLADNVSLLSPELLAAVNGLVVESGHAAAGKKPGAPLAGRCDSFVAETDVHYPTDVSLLWDAMRCLLRETGRAAEKSGAGGWRQWKHLSRSVRRLFHRVRATRRARPEHVEAYLARCLELAARAEADLADLAAHGAKAWEIVEIEGYIAHAKRQIDQIDRRLLKGETIPHGEKVFSIFEPHTRWISKGKFSEHTRRGVRWSLGFRSASSRTGTASSFTTHVAVVLMLRWLRRFRFDRGFAGFSATFHFGSRPYWMAGLPVLGRTAEFGFLPSVPSCPPRA